VTTDSPTAIQGGRRSDPEEVARDRPKVFTPGSPVGMHLRVERVVRIGGDRIIYLVNNHNPRWHSKKCWSCGNKQSPPRAQACTYCSRPLGPRRFLMSARWSAGSALEYQAYAHRRLRSRSLGEPLALYRYREQLLACFAWAGDQLLINEPAPLPAATVLSLTFQIADALATLHAHGVLLEKLAAHQVLLHPSGSARLFDLEVKRLVDRPLPANDDPTSPPLKDLRELASMMVRWVDPADRDIIEYLQSVRRGQYRTADALAAGVSSFAWSRKVDDPTHSVASISDTGIVRRENEDAWGWRQLRTPTRSQPGLTAYVVADGMGGHGHGAEASALAVRTVLRTLRRSLPDDGSVATPEQLELILHDAMEAANEAVVLVNEERGLEMGTTLVALLQQGANVLVGNLGDSRAYLLRGGEMRQLTEDHSLVGARVAAGKLTQEEARNHPQANVLLHYLGRERDADADVYQLDAKPGDRFLLCTDGLWGQVDGRRLATLLSEHRDPRRTVRRLLRSANDAGGPDNITAMLIDVPRPGDRT